ncbi:hypothetical protein [Singulisphaera acidiphila]|uniref:Haem-binding uptake Tiki superfamily ChaN domain-containing protein n=1 Tax=Singulisphaera acidiphila (strain ATCC BAA-1392 / DSM 18658 / VKM B-2454 / MOB10) TaxID=886293 RepID=L0DI18_SINAD|nr:hypothetical protein [Singulisphaera acidiphila]AGA28453.1 hypothetical protein Sinac_4252 [Singulisphaera acidiphila DSM 18658]
MGGNGVRVPHFVIALAYLLSSLAIPSVSYAADLKPYPLPPAARADIEKLAASSNVLILGETHGTQEVPELTASLLEPLAKLDYHILAIEVPNKEQASLLAWAHGKTERVPDFFANPSGDGRGNAQLLSLVRIAVSPPFRWQVICFDDTESMLEQQRLILMQKKPTGGAEAPQLTAEDGIALWRARDAAMAANLLRETKSLKTTSKILAVCGNLHARVTNDMQDPDLSKLWPSFAGMLKQGQPAWRVSSVNIEFYRGAFFNEGKVRTIQGRPLEHAVVRSADQTGWNLELSLPEATPATFHFSK